MSSVSSDRQYRVSSGSGIHSHLSREFILEIRSGKTRYPNRPLPKGRLSIGSGSKCWLQLGGPNIPEIHSWMEVGQKEIALYVFEDDPPIQVNGNKVQFATLKGGESLQIGPFEFIVHADIDQDPHAPWHKPHLTPEQVASLKTGLEKPVDQLSAEELAELLEAEMMIVEQQEARERAGMLKLMQAVRETQRELEIEATQPHAPDATTEASVESPPDATEQFIARIEETTRSLKERADYLRIEETEYAQVAEHLLRSQERLIEQMDQLMTALDAQQADPHESESSDDPPHAIAG